MLTLISLWLITIKQKCIKDETTVHVYSGLVACFYGWYGSMYATILIDTIGLDKFQSSLGFVSVIHGLSIGTIFPISGW